MHFVRIARSDTNSSSFATSLATSATFLILLSALVTPSAQASTQPSSKSDRSIDRFFFEGTSASDGNVARGLGLGDQPFSIRGLGVVSSADGDDVAVFILTGTVYCAGGPPPMVPCFGLQGTVIGSKGKGIDGARLGDPVVAILVQRSDHTGSTCIILPAPGLSGICDNFAGTVVLPK